MVVNKEFIAAFMLLFSAVFGIIMGLGFTFIGYTQDNIALLISGIIMGITGLVCATLMREE
jgi:uncharacterized membrane protein YjjP (DUF1212 family)